MKSIMDAIGYAIDFVAVFIQLPYIVIAGCIASAANRAGRRSKVTYVWRPFTGVNKIWKEPNGDCMFVTLTYKELFN